MNRIELVAGVGLVGVGVAGILAGPYGAGPLDMLTASVSTASGWSFAAVGASVQVVFGAGALALGRRPRLLPTLAAGATGVVVQATLPVWASAVAVAGPAAVFAAGAALLALGLAVYVASDCGEAPTEALMVALEGRLKLPRAGARMAIDTAGLGAAMTVAGSGRVGLGTLALLAANGPALQVSTVAYARVRPQLATTARRVRPHLATTAGRVRPHLASTAGRVRPHVATTTARARARRASAARRVRPHLAAAGRRVSACRPRRRTVAPACL